MNLLYTKTEEIGKRILGGLKDLIKSKGIS